MKKPDYRRDAATMRILNGTLLQIIDDLRAIVRAQAERLDKPRYDSEDVYCGDGEGI